MTPAPLQTVPATVAYSLEQLVALPGGFLEEQGFRLAGAVLDPQVEQDRREERRLPETEAIDVVAVVPL